jgi:hypothetical protein
MMNESGARRASELGSRELNSAARMRICSANTKRCSDYTTVLAVVEEASASCLMRARLNIKVALFFKLLLAAKQSDPEKSR